MSLSAPRALLFDWDNTLVDTWPSIQHALAITFEAMGQRPWTLEETKARVRASARDSFPLLFGERAKEATAIFYRAFEAEHLGKLREREGAGAMLASLAGEGRYLAVVSNKRGELLRREARHLGWSDYFGSLVGANDAPRDKPAVEPVELALSSSGIARGAEVWFVGDTDIDMRCAVNAGCVPVLLRPEAPAAGEFGDAEPRFHIVSCSGLVDLLAAS
ncbi:MAG: HAD family hydrolase [Kiloniellales bacterium]